MGNETSAWLTSLLAEITRQYGQPRAVADFAQAAHLAGMLALLDDWVPDSFPGPATIDVNYATTTSADDVR